jgi:23S rRNA-/tRNA-specific pseudouridylate synthase
MSSTASNDNFKRRKVEEKDSSSFYIECGGFRHVVPFVAQRVANTKKRWWGKTLLDALSGEFTRIKKEHWRQMIEAERVLLKPRKRGKRNLEPDAPVTDPGMEVAAHMTFVVLEHMHEPPVRHVPVDDLVLQENQFVLVANKPSSVPVHSSGPFMHNSLVNILASDGSRPALKNVHRLDRLTSGVCLFGKGASAKTLTGLFREDSVSKYYLARTKGDFRAATADAESLSVHQMEVPAAILAGLGLQEVPEGAARVVCAQDILVVRGCPETLETLAHTWQEKFNMLRLSGLTCDAPLVDAVCGASPVVTRKSVDAKTGFWSLFYDAASDTSVVLCRPFTGRSHQIRVHLDFLGFPIANDPFHSGALMPGQNSYCPKTLFGGVQASGLRAAFGRARLVGCVGCSFPADEEEVVEEEEELQQEGNKEDEKGDKRYQPEGPAMSGYAHYDHEVERITGIWLHAYRYEFGLSEEQKKQLPWLDEAYMSPAPQWALSLVKK